MGQLARMRRVLLTMALLLLFAAPMLEALQRFGSRSRRSYVPAPDPYENAEFFFARLAYSSGYYGRGGWRTDYPEAEYHFMQGVRRLTIIDAAEGGRVVRPLDEEIFEYPWLYAVEVGRWYLDEQEAATMREYLDRGGFLVVDDFHGGDEWSGFAESMNRVYPERAIVEIEEGDPILHVLYDLDQRIQIPGVQYVWSGSSSERWDGAPAHWRGIYDENNRLVVAINYNMDLGDAWEHADMPEYPEKMTALAYRFGINYVIYAMTH